MVTPVTIGGNRGTWTITSDSDGTGGSLPSAIELTGDNNFVNASINSATPWLNVGVRGIAMRGFGNTIGYLTTENIPSTEIYNDYANSSNTLYPAYLNTVSYEDDDVKYEDEVVTY